MARAGLLALAAGVRACVQACSAFFCARLWRDLSCYIQLERVTVFFLDGACAARAAPVLLSPRLLRNQNSIISACGELSGSTFEGATARLGGLVCAAPGICNHMCSSVVGAVTWPR